MPGSWPIASATVCLSSSTCEEPSNDLVRRVVDFSSGLIYALDGSMRKVGDGLVVVLPRVTLSRDEKRRLATLGAYELDDIDD